MKIFNKKADIKKLVLLTNMALMSFIMPTVANAETLTPTLGNDSAYTWTKVDSLLENTFANYIYNKTTNELEKEYWQWAIKSGINSESRKEYKSGQNNGNITGNFIGNNVDFAGSFGAGGDVTGCGAACGCGAGGADINKAFGGAIYKSSSGKIGSITGDFIDNYVKSANNTAHGGAIYNSCGGEIGSITGDFIDNHASTSPLVYYDASGGAIYNGSTIGEIKGNFVGNWAKSEDDTAKGGAIFNTANIRKIVANFFDNFVVSQHFAEGGAVYNNSSIQSITGDFKGNYVDGTGCPTNGGAIYNGENGQIAFLTGDFENNYANNSTADAEGGAIYNRGIIEALDVNFTKNYAKSKSGSAYGGAIYNYDGTISSITGDFIGNYASGFNAYGGAIYNDYRSTIGNITGDFIGNYAQGNYAYGGAIYNYNSTIGDITGDFIGNYASGFNAYGGAIYNYISTIGDITGDFISNYASSSSYKAYGGAIYNYYTSTIGDITGDFIGNYAQGKSAYGGAIYNYISTIGSKNANGNLTGGLINSSFINNYAKSESGTAEGGAIWTNKDMNFIAQDGYTSIISGNYVEDKDGKRAEAIRVVTPTSSTYVGYLPINGTTTKEYIYEYKTPTFSFINNTNSKTIIDDQIIGTSAEYTEGMYYSVSSKKQYVELNEDGTYHDIATPEAKVHTSKLNITGDGTGLVQLNNDVINMDVSLSNSTLHLASRDNVLDNNNLTINSGTLSMINNNAGTMTLSSLTVQGDTNLAVDVDLTNKISDTITTTNVSTGVVTISGLNLFGSSSQSVTVKVLNTQNSDLQLALSNELSQGGEVYLGEVSRVIDATNVKAVTNWDDIYGALSETQKTYGTIALATTVTTNDSITLNNLRTEINKVITSQINDTLAYVNKNDGGFAERAFNFDSAENVYEVKENLGNTAGKLTINGVADGEDKSTIDINSHSGFVLDSGSELSLSNVELENASGKALTLNSGATANIENVTFKNNGYASSSSFSEVFGGAIYNNGTIDDITGDFSGNYAQGQFAFGGAIYNNGTIGDITGDFIGNYASKCGGAIYNYDNGIISGITGDFIGNYALSSFIDASGGAIFNYGTIGDITGNFIGNYAQSFDAVGGAIWSSGVIGNITGDFIDNYVLSSETHSIGGAISNIGIIGNITGNFSNNYAQSSGEGASAQGGAIYSDGTIGSKNSEGDIVGGIINSSFIGNYAKSEKGLASGGAIYASYSDLNVIAKDDYVSIFKDNYIESAGIKDDNAIALDNAKLNFQMINGGKFVMNDNITAVHVDVQDFLKDFGVSSLEEYAVVEEGYKNAALETFLGWTGFSSIEEFVEAEGYSSLEELLADYGYETFEEFMKEDWGLHGETPLEQLFYSYGVESEDEFLREMGYGSSTVTIQGDDINNTVFYLYNDINKAHVNIGNTTLNTINNIPHNYNFHSFTLTAPINMAVDVDLANRTMDRITADAYGEHTGTLNVSAMNLLSDATTDKTEILFAEAGLKDNVTTTVSEVAYSPIYKYNVSYDKSGENGMFVFARPTVGGTGSTGNASDAFNPAILAGSTSAAVGAVGTVNQAVHHSFNNVDAYMNIPYMERMAMKRRNHYALAGVPDDVRQLGKYSPLYLPGDEEESVWVKPYTTFESVPLKNGPKVSNISYGTLVGFDSQMQSLRHGWDRVISGYVGYTGASQRYSGVDATQNGGILGGTVTLYKGNFFNATTLNVGSSVSQNETMYGKDDYTMLMSGIANKTGYNLEFKDGKVILQPSMLVGYTFVNTFDYTNAAGVKIDNKPLHTIQVSPGVKVIGNLKHGWQPYASVNMVWNLMGEYDATANGVKLPEMKVKPYVQYGVGLQKRVKDHFMAYGQAMLHNGGRNGISLTAGFRWALGHKDNCDYEIKEIKSDKKAVKVKTNKKAKQTEVKPEKKVLKELSSERKAQIILADKNSFKINKN